MSEDDAAALLGTFVTLGAAWFVVDEKGGTRSGSLRNKLSTMQFVERETVASFSNVTPELLNQLVQTPEPVADPARPRSRG
jgi:hypothetical protein